MSGIRKPDSYYYTIDSKTGCWNFNKIQRNGYGSMRMFNAKFNSTPHRYFYTKHIGTIPNGYEIDHLCHNKKCVNPQHLEAVTTKVNLERRLSVKLNWGIVSEIKKLAKRLNQKEIGLIFNINQGHVSKIINGKRWKGGRCAYN